MQNLAPAPSYTGPLWFARSSTPSRYYAVSVDPATNLYRCECPDHTYRHRDCKHIKAVQAGAIRPAKRKEARPVPAPTLPKPVTTAPARRVRQEDPELDAWLDDLYGPRKAVA